MSDVLFLMLILFMYGRIIHVLVSSRIRGEGGGLQNGRGLNSATETLKTPWLAHPTLTPFCSGFRVGNLSFRIVNYT